MGRRSEAERVRRTVSRMARKVTGLMIVKRDFGRVNWTER